MCSHDELLRSLPGTEWPDAPTPAYLPLEPLEAAVSSSVFDGVGTLFPCPLDESGLVAKYYQL